MSTKPKTRQAGALSVEIAEEGTAPVSRINAEFAPTVVKGIYNSRQQDVMLGEKVGVGGEGTVYNIQGQAEFVAKIYHEIPSAEKAAKLIALVQRGTERLFKMSAWPVDVLRDRPDGHVIGFVMNKIGQAEEVHALHSPKSRLKKFPEASWAFLLHVATNIARALATMHEHGFVVGDVNPKNILVTKKATVYLLDCDSFQFSSAGKTYRCEGGFPEYTPPELQGLAFSDVDRTQAHDCFGLAVVIFQLLFLGRHPYSGRYAGAEEMPLERAIQEGRFAYGTDAAQRNMHPPPGTLAFDGLPSSLTELLRRAFLDIDRPNPHEWIAPLTQLTQALQRCVMHSGHYFYEALTECPWCQIETRARLRLFNFNPTEARQYPSAFRVDEIWAELEKLQWLEPQEQRVTAIPHLSPAVMEYAKQRRLRFWLAIIFAGLSGIFSALVGIRASFWLMPIFLLTVRWIADIKRQRVDKSTQMLFNAPFVLPSHPLAQEIAMLRKGAEESIRELEKKLGGEKEKQTYITKVNDLAAKLEAYQALPETEHRKFQLEHEITSGTYYLRQLKQRIEAKQQQLLPALAKARQTVADADKNLEVLSWRNRAMPITLVLILAFVLTLIITSNSRPYIFDALDTIGEEVQAPHAPINLTIKANESQSEQQRANSLRFETLYNAGKERVKGGNLTGAKESFESAAALVNRDRWIPDYASLYYDLYVVEVKLGVAQEHIQSLENLMRLYPYFQFFRFQLTLLYSLTGNSDEATYNRQILRTTDPVLADCLEIVLLAHGFH